MGKMRSEDQKLRDATRLARVLDETARALQTTFWSNPGQSPKAQDTLLNIDNNATALCEIAAGIAGFAREMRGQPKGHARLKKAVRKALGFTYP